MSPVDSTGSSSRPSRHRLWLVGVGLIWLVLGLSLLFYQRNLATKVEIEWETATEQGTVGFNLYRSPEIDGEYVLVNQNEFIESQGSSVSGASYTYVDNEVVPGNTYYYVLEEIETDGSRKRYEEDRFKYVAPSTANWLILLSAVCSLIGVVMIFAGFKEGRKK